METPESPYACIPPVLSAGIAAAFGERLWGRDGFRQNGGTVTDKPKRNPLIATLMDLVT